MNHPLALIELYGHYEVLYGYCRRLSAAGRPLAVLTNATGYEEAPPDLRSRPAIEWVVRPDSQSIPRFLERCAPLLEKCALLLFTTLASDFAYFARRQWPVPAMLVLHSGNYWLDPAASVSLRSIADVLRWLRELATRRPHFRRRILDRMSFLAFPNDHILNHFIASGKVTPERAAPPLPFAAFEGVPEPAQAEPILTVTVPGTVVQESRDYRLVWEAFSQLAPALSRPVRLVLLGRPKRPPDRALIRRFRSLQTDRLTCVAFDGYLPQALYDHWLRRTDFLILPLLRDIRYIVYRETGGLTKLSGSVNDMIRFGIPALISAEYYLEADLQACCLPFSGPADLAEKLLNWIEGEGFRTLREKMPELLDAYREGGEKGIRFLEWLESIQPGNDSGGDWK